MPSHSKSSTAQLEKDLENVTQALEAAAPDLYAEMVLLTRLLEARRGNVENLYRDAGGKKESVILCLQLAEGEWLTIEQILERMTKGGYPWKASTGRGLLNDGLNYYVKIGEVLRRGDLYGLPDRVQHTPAEKAE